MSKSLPEMEGGWDDFFDETYLLTCPAFVDDRDTATEPEAEGAARLAGLEPDAEVLDCPCGFARHALLLTEAGYRVTGADRSEIQLAEAERRRGGAEWPRLVRADYRELPFVEESFDAVLCLFSSLGLLDRESDLRVLSEFRRVLRPGGALVMETLHRDHLARTFRPRDWKRLPDGGVLVMERDFDLAAGAVSAHHLLFPAEGERTSREFVFRVYTVTEWMAMLREAGFGGVECFAGWEGAPASPDSRLVVRAA